MDDEEDTETQGPIASVIYLLILFLIHPPVLFSIVWHGTVNRGWHHKYNAVCINFRYRVICDCGKVYIDELDKEE